jgi:hypothetical protein
MMQPNTQNVAFSHRSKAGISIGVYVENNVAYLAATFRHTNDTHDNVPEHSGNRRLARQIIVNRLRAAVNAADNGRDIDAIQFVDVWRLGNINTDSRSIMNSMRHLFKSDPLENDFLFYDRIGHGNLLPRKEAWDIITFQFQEAIKSLASTECVS